MGMLMIKTNSQLMAEEAQREASLLELLKGEEPIGLVAHLRKMWQDAKEAKKPIDEQILKNERAIRGEYDPDKLAAIREIGGSEIYLKITEVKCRHFEAWVRDIYEQPGGVPWMIEPTPRPSLPEALEAEILQDFVQEMTQFFVTQVMTTQPEANVDQFVNDLKNKTFEMRGKLKRWVKEKAKEKAEEMTEVLQDQLYEGGWYAAFHELIRLVPIKCGILKGPILRKHYTKKQEVDANGNITIKTEEEILPTWEARHPKDIFPQPGIVDIQKGYLFDRIAYTPAEIEQFIGLPNFDEKEIRAVLDECENGSLREWTERDQEWAEVEGHNPSKIYDWERVDCLHFWGPIKGKLLHEFNESWKTQCPDEQKYYHIEAYLIGNHIIKLVLNPEPNGEKPYCKVSFKEDGTFFGMGLPEVIEDIQSACNSCARALVNNVGMASGPQVAIFEDLLSEFDKGHLMPWKKWVLKNPFFSGGGAGRPLEFYQPSLIGHELIAIFNFFLKLADEHSGVPAYAHGDPQVGGAGNTASGLSMLLAQSARGIKLVVKNIDEKIIEESIKRQYKWNLSRKRFSGLIGDYKIRAKGTMAIIAREQQVFRLNELLSITANEIDMSIIGAEGRKKLLKEIFKAHEIDPKEIFDEVQPVYTPLNQGQPQVAGPPVVTPLTPGVAPQPKPTELGPGGMPMGGEESRLISSYGGHVPVS